MKESTLEKNLMSANSVASVSERQITLGSTTRYTLEKSPVVVKRVEHVISASCVLVSSAVLGTLWNMARSIGKTSCLTALSIYGHTG